MMRATRLGMQNKEGMQTFIRSLYANLTDGLRIPQTEMNTSFKHGEYSPTYGEITYSGGEILFSDAFSRFGEGVTKLNFLDLGSGVGKLCMQAALNHGTKLRSVIGVEISPSRHAIAMKAYKNLQNTQNISCIDILRLVEGDILNFPLPNDAPAIVYCASLTFSRAVIEKLASNCANELLPGSIIYSLRPLQNPSIKRVGEILVPTDWSKASTLCIHQTS